MNKSNWIGRVGEEEEKRRIIIRRLGAGGRLIDHRNDPEHPGYDFEVVKPNIFTGKL